MDMPKTEAPEALLTLREVSLRLRCSLSNAYNLVAQGRLQAYRVGAGNAGLRVSEEQLREFLAESVVGMPAAASRPKERKFKHLT